MHPVPQRESDAFDIKLAKRLSLDSNWVYRDTQVRDVQQAQDIPWEILSAEMYEGRVGDLS